MPLKWNKSAGLDNISNKYIMENLNLSGALFTKFNKLINLILNSGIVPKVFSYYHISSQNKGIRKTQQITEALPYYDSGRYM